MMITSLIIIKIRFVCFSENEIGRSRVRLYTKSYARSHARSHDYRFCDPGITIAFLFSMSFDKQVIIKKAICNKVKNLLS